MAAVDSIRSRSAGRISLVVLGAAALSVALAFLARALVDEGPWTTFDLQVFHASGEAVLRGDNPYLYWLEQDQLSLVYPPFAGLLFALLGLLSMEAVRIVWFTGIFLAVQGIVWLTTGWIGVRRRWVRLGAGVAAAGLFLLFNPGWQELWSGNINTFLALLIVADLVRRDGARGRGVLIGVAAGIKLTPGLFILYFLLTRRFREAWTALGTFAVTVVAGFAVLPGPAWDYWRSHAWDADRIYPFPNIPLNQNLRGMLARLTGDPDVSVSWLLAAVVVAVGGLAVCVALHRRGLVTEAAVLVGVIALLVSPVSWAYHWVWLVPALIVLGAHAVRTRSWTWGGAVVLTAAAAFVAPYTFMPLDEGMTPSTVAQQFETNSLTIAGLLLLVAAVVAVVRPRPDPVPAA
ncbi:glycosyltransferase 87 family protein [Actinophytocola xinjiangensis]|uniref:glycosyltransferase 87 family protein n=1 Tax=Actinophytocola xinjiangensis TaxID=485602 RepID=UPI000A064660|nr:glycosyltransferase 87 family protein [Actinophytocola xinjiangensis]